jgi:hypothetical protein
LRRIRAQRGYEVFVTSRPSMYETFWITFPRNVTKTIRRVRRARGFAPPQTWAFDRAVDPILLSYCRSILTHSTCSRCATVSFRPLCSCRQFCTPLWRLSPLEWKLRLYDTASTMLQNILPKHPDTTIALPFRKVTAKNLSQSHLHPRSSRLVRTMKTLS